MPSAALLVFLAAGSYQLNLPGLHYDEAKEAGLNAMQIVTGQSLTAFRDATIRLGPLRLPLMVQDYIGALNVLLATPLLRVAGISVIALRWLPLLIGGLTLLLAWRVAWRLGGPVAAAATALLLAVNPGFIFWSRQGIFVTNLTALLLMASLLAGHRWWQQRRPGDLCLLALLWGLGLYAKLLFAWAIGGMVILAIAAHLAGSRPSGHRQGTSPATAFVLCGAVICFLAPLTPLVLFNLQTGGTLSSIFGNLGRSYYGVNNLAYLPNLQVRIEQVRTLLRGDHLWYLGELYPNQWAPWLAVGLTGAALLVSWLRGKGTQPLLAPLLLLSAIVAQSAFTVSDLFITHDALFLPLIPLIGGLAAGALWQAGADAMTTRKLARPAGVAVAVAGVAALLWWAGSDAQNTIRYQQILGVSGGYGTHSDAIYRLSSYLEQTAPSAPLALDWGMDAPIRFLTGGRVNPLEVFGYASLDAPDNGFAARLAPFLASADSLYMAHVPDQTVFRGRVEALQALATQQGKSVREVARFSLRSGQPLFVVYRVVKGP